MSNLGTNTGRGGSQRGDQAEYIFDNDLGILEFLIINFNSKVISNCGKLHRCTSKIRGDWASMDYLCAMAL